MTMNSDENNRAKSPCIKKCRLDENHICTDCFRTIQEIAAWPDADNEERKKILVRIELRKLSR